MTRTEQATASLREISRLSDRTARKAFGFDKGWSSGEIAHAVVKKEYGEKTYRAARRVFFGFGK